MADEREFSVRPGRIRSSGAQSTKPFIAQAMAAARKAGGNISRSGRISPGNRSQFGRGRTASIQANRLLTGRSRVVVIKTRVVRHTPRAAPLTAHVSYLQREGVTRDGEKAHLFGPETDDANGRAFAERCEDDRHHFRFIVSPEDAADMEDLKSFSRDLMGQMEKDLGTTLDWVGVDHWNTDNPHVHILLRGRTDDGQDLVISRDYIKEGMRARAEGLVTQELGPRTDLDIRHHLERQVEAERWTQLDRQLARDGGRGGIIDMAPPAEGHPDKFHALKIGRLHKLETLGLAEQVGPGQWIIGDEAEATLDDYVAAGIMVAAQAEALRRAVAERRNILVAGGTSTGKTTLTNALLAEVAKTSDRVVLIEDTRELQCAAPNLVAMRTKDGVASLSDLVRSSLRLRPDRIPIGEVRGSEALDLLKAWGTGHPGGIGTIHAGNAIGALRRLEQLIQEVVVTVPRALIAETIDLVAVLAGRGSSRRLAELGRVEGLGPDGDYRVTPVAPAPTGDSL